MNHTMSSRRRLLVLAVIALALAALACGGGADPPPTPVPPTAAPVVPTPVPATAVPIAPVEQGGSKGSTGAASLILENQSDEALCALYVGPNGDPDWGDNQLGAGVTVEPGADFTLTDIPPGSYDMRVDTCAGDTAERYAVDIVNTFTWTIVNETETGAGGTGVADLVIVNNSSQTICYVYVSPNGSPEWGDDQLGEANVVAPGGTFTINNIPAGVYDIKATDCDGNSLAERFGVDIQVRFTWTLTN